MKKLILTIACVLAAVAAYGQGTVNFKNKSTVDAPVYDGAVGGTKLAGADFVAQMFAGPTASSLEAIGATAPFRTGTGAGYWNAVPSDRTIGTVVPGNSAFIQVKVWEVTKGATYEASQTAGGKVGMSDVFSVTTGGAGAPPSLPADLTGLKSFGVVAIPEPTTIALGLLGAAALLIRRRQ